MDDAPALRRRDGRAWSADGNLSGEADGLLFRYIGDLRPDRNVDQLFFLVSHD